MLTLWQARDVAQSYYGYSAGGSIPHSAKTFAKQTFMQEMSHRWKCEYAMRTEVWNVHTRSTCRNRNVHTRPTCLILWLDFTISTYPFSK